MGPQPGCPRLLGCAYSKFRQARTLFTECSSVKLLAWQDHFHPCSPEAEPRGADTLAAACLQSGHHSMAGVWQVP